MARGDASSGFPGDLCAPQVRLFSSISNETIGTALDQLAKAECGDGPITVEVNTLGGDPEAARRLVLELDLLRKRDPGREIVFLGKTAVYSAGVTLMAGFPARDRYLTRDARLLIHCRQLDKTIDISGPMRGSRAKIESLLHEMDTGIELETENFERLIEGSDVTLDELLEKALYNWYVPAAEAARRGLVAAAI